MVLKHDSKFYDEILGRVRLSYRSCRSIHTAQLCSTLCRIREDARDKSYRLNRPLHFLWGGSGGGAGGILGSVNCKLYDPPAYWVLAT